MVKLHCLLTDNPQTHKVKSFNRYCFQVYDVNIHLNIFVHCRMYGYHTRYLQISSVLSREDADSGTNSFSTSNPEIDERYGKNKDRSVTNSPGLKCPSLGWPGVVLMISSCYRTSCHNQNDHKSKKHSTF